MFGFGLIPDFLFFMDLCLPQILKFRFLNFAWTYAQFLHGTNTFIFQQRTAVSPCKQKCQTVIETRHLPPPHPHPASAHHRLPREPLTHPPYSPVHPSAPRSSSRGVDMSHVAKHADSAGGSNAATANPIAAAALAGPETERSGQAITWEIVRAKRQPKKSKTDIIWNSISYDDDM